MKANDAWPVSIFFFFFEPVLSNDSVKPIH